MLGSVFRLAMFKVSWNVSKVGISCILQISHLRVVCIETMLLAELASSKTVQYL